jgi:hypothetical protein
MEKKRTQVPQKSAKVDILPISIYLVVVLYRHKHCRPQKVELDLACRDSTTTKTYFSLVLLLIYREVKKTQKFASTLATIFYNFLFLKVNFKNYFCDPMSFIIKNINRFFKYLDF